MSIYCSSANSHLNVQPREIVYYDTSAESRSSLHAGVYKSPSARALKRPSEGTPSCFRTSIVYYFLTQVAEYTTILINKLHIDVSKERLSLDFLQRYYGFATVKKKSFFVFSPRLFLYNQEDRFESAHCTDIVQRNLYFVISRINCFVSWNLLFQKLFIINFFSLEWALKSINSIFR